MRLQLLNTSANTTKVRRKIFLHPEFLSLKRMNFHSSMRADAISENFFSPAFLQKIAFGSLFSEMGHYYEKFYGSPAGDCGLF